jgi:4-aminobutyrate aminotransferase-like enzyme
MTVPQPLVLGTRRSELARRQANEVKNRLEAHGYQVELRTISTRGDESRDVPISEIGDEAVFTRALDRALLAGEIHLAVHSLKDIPTSVPDGVTMAAIGPREAPFDVFVAHPSFEGGLEDLPKQATLATASLRRKAQLRAWRSDLEVVPVRGNVDPAEVSYVILEPIQGEGGYHVPSDAFMDELADLVDTHDLTLVADEIQSGVGRTGEMWGADHYAIEPDVIAAAKALRVGATIGREEVFPEETGRLSSTWGAGDVHASAAGAFTLDIIQERDLMANAIERGRQFTETVTDADPAGVTDVRGKGLMIGVEFDTQQRRDDVHRTAFEHGLLLLKAGSRTIRV